jgi:serine-type D-Ala-D-Ala carboxypeptidase/endopeptidase (penicillin-binding protein 4)
VADAQPSSYNRRLVEALWRDMGGQIDGSVREGGAPSELRPTFEQRSPPLAEAVRDINKHSNNVMAQQLFLTLALVRDATRPATPAAARDLLQRWLAERLGDDAADTVIDNGSGLSRHGRIPVRALARLLQAAYDSPWMPELMASLPIAGADGTLRRARVPPRAHLKTGSLRDVVGVAGYVLAQDGRRYVLVAVVNHPQAQAARPALDALLQWTLRGAAN